MFVVDLELLLAALRVKVAARLRLAGLPVVAFVAFHFMWAII